MAYWCSCRCWLIMCSSFILSEQCSMDTCFFLKKEIPSCITFAKQTSRLKYSRMCCKQRFTKCTWFLPMQHVSKLSFFKRSPATLTASFFLQSSNRLLQRWWHFLPGKKHLNVLYLINAELVRRHRGFQICHGRFTEFVAPHEATTLKITCFGRESGMLP